MEWFTAFYTLCGCGILLCGMGMCGYVWHGMSMSMAQLSPASTPVTIFRALQLRLTPGTLATAKSDDFYLAEARTGLPIGEVGLK